MRRILLIISLSLAASCGTARGPIVGQQFDKWTKGYLEIHSVNTGRGESFFYILPDGTTLLIDASGANPLDDELENHGNTLTPAKPSADLSPGRVVADYVRHFLPAEAGGALDYAMISHYHGDHMGVIVEGLPKHPEGGFALAGISPASLKKINALLIKLAGHMVYESSLRSFCLTRHKALLTDFSDFPVALAISAQLMPE